MCILSHQLTSVSLPLLFIMTSENEKNCVEKNVSTPGISIYFEAYLYGTGNYSSSTWQFPASSLLTPPRRPSMGDDEEEHDSPVEGQPEKVKKPKKVYCYISPKVSDLIFRLAVSVIFFSFILMYLCSIAATLCEGVLSEDYSMAPFHFSCVPRNEGNEFFQQQIHFFYLFFLIFLKGILSVTHFPVSSPTMGLTQSIST